MHDMLARLRAGLGDQLGVQRRLAVVEMPLGQDPDHTVEIKEGGVGARCRVIVAERSDDQPRSWAKEIFAAQLGKGGLDPGVGDTRRGHHLSRIGAPHKAEFLFPIGSPTGFTARHTTRQRVAGVRGAAIRRRLQ